MLAAPPSLALPSSPLLNDALLPTLSLASFLSRAVIAQWSSLPMARRIGYLVLGLIVERVTGQSYYDYVRDHIFRPAGMTHTGYYDPNTPDSAIAVGYTTEGPEGERPGPPVPNDDQREIRGGPAGGGYSTAGDLLRFARALWANVLLKPASTMVATTGKVSMGRAGVMYAYGFGVEQRDGLRSVGHEGGFPGVSSSIAMYPDLGYTVVVLANEDPPSSSVIANRARALLVSAS